MNVTYFFLRYLPFLESDSESPEDSEASSIPEKNLPRFALVPRVLLRSREGRLLNVRAFGCSFS